MKNRVDYIPRWPCLQNLQKSVSSVSELERIMQFMSWNGFSRSLSRKLKKSLFSHRSDTNDSHDKPGNRPKIWIRLPFTGKYGNHLTRKFISRVNPLLNKPCNFIVNWKTTNSNCYLSCKDRTPKEYQSSVVYRFSCPGSQAAYIGKTDTLQARTVQSHQFMGTISVH